MTTTWPVTCQSRVLFQEGGIDGGPSDINANFRLKQG
jgi:hypothetical protein